MNPLTLNAMLILFIIAVVTTLWRWWRDRDPLQITRLAIFTGGVVFYSWMQTESYDPELSRWWVRALFVAWLLPEILENVEIIREEKTTKHRG